MGFTGLEPIIDKLISELRDNLPAKITSLSDSLAPSIPMDPPKDYSFGERSGHLLGFPAIEVVPERSPVERDNQARMEFRHQIALGLFVVHDDEEKLARLLLRYTRAVLETLADRRAADAFTSATPGFQIDWNEQEIDYSVTRITKQGLFERDAWIPLRCTLSESRT